MSKFAIVIPCFNEESRLNLAYWNRIIIENEQCTWLFVDDGSSDGTLEILNQIAKSETVSFISLIKNVGKAEAVRSGILELLGQQSNFDWVGYLDADGAFSPEDINSLMISCDTNETKTNLIKADVLIAARVALAGRTVQRNAMRHYIGRIVATLICRNWIDSPYDTQSGYKMFANSNSFQVSLKETFRTRWFVDIEIMSRVALNKDAKLRVWEEPVTTWYDVTGSKLGFRHYFRILNEARYARSQVKLLINHSKGLE
jgi:glycosyltransferase involved in cell wall biosynthesis